MVSRQEDLKTQQQNYTKEILVLKMEIKRKQKEVNDLKKELEQYIAGDRKIEDEFGKTLDQVIEEYRHSAGRRTLQQSKSVRLMQRPEGNKRNGMRESSKK